MGVSAIFVGEFVVVCVNGGVLLNFVVESPLESTLIGGDESVQRRVLEGSWELRARLLMHSKTASYLN